MSLANAWPMSSPARRLAAFVGVVAAAIATSGGLCEVPLCSARDETSGVSASGKGPASLDFTVDANAATTLGFQVSVEGAAGPTRSTITFSIDGAACDSPDGGDADCSKSLALDEQGHPSLPWFYLDTRERCIESCTSHVHLGLPAGSQLSWKIEVVAMRDTRQCTTKVRIGK